MTSLLELARRALALCETAEADGCTEDQPGDALEAVEVLSVELETRIRRVVEEGDARQFDRVAR